MSVIWLNTVEPIITKEVKLPYPYYNEGLKYTGTEISPQWIGYDPKSMTISGTVVAIDKGTYNTTFVLKDGFCWNDGSMNEYSVEWTIFEDLFEYPEQESILTYNESSLSPTWINYDASVMLIDGDTSAINAGTYNSVFTLNDGYGWIDGSNLPYSVTWKIEKRAGIKSYTPSTISISLSSSESKFFKIYFYEETFYARESSGANPTGIAAVGLYSSNSGVYLDTYEIEPISVGTTTYTYTTKETTNHKSATAKCVITVTA